ncbi:hypothetical protein [Phormidium sp. CCY1219]|uniref:hypothetical protein n=1 Tax=Phormidium sp. CCY1219 TaxID=2886104 RepID=UPI002D1E5291|nr:hypothetical protein [Phormidium sp. CCY1219]MEB3830132.1 hypothetical protein [Phormidium sp. CCY1219]
MNGKRSPATPGKNAPRSSPIGDRPLEIEIAVEAGVKTEQGDRKSSTLHGFSRDSLFPLPGSLL